MGSAVRPLGATHSRPTQTELAFEGWTLALPLAGALASLHELSLGTWAGGGFGIIGLLGSAGVGWVLTRRREVPEEVVVEAPTVTQDLSAVRVQVEALRAALAAVDDQTRGAAMGIQATAGMAGFGATQGVDQVLSLSAFADQMAASVATVAEHSQIMATQVEAVAGASDEVKVAVDSVVGMADAIGRIASQTRLLAFNAQIEAARAGKSGAGFAIVAEEVKTLALEVGSAAGKIRRTVDELRPRTDVLVDGTRSAKIAAREIAEATSQQAQTATEMSRVIRDASDAVGSVGDGIQQLSAQGDALVVTLAGLTALVAQVDSVTAELSAAPVVSAQPRRPPRTDT